MSESPLHQINDLIHAKVRLGIMSLLMTHKQCDFAFLKKRLETTDGNLSSHIQKLEQANYISVEKEFVGRKPKTSIKVTNLGSDAYKEYITTLESILKVTLESKG